MKQKNDVFKAWQEALKENKNRISPYVRDDINNVISNECERSIFFKFQQHYKKLVSLPRRVRRNLKRQWKHSIAGIALMLALGAGPAMGATINVDAGAVDEMVNGNCSLIEAINSANTDAAVDNCTAGSGADEIVLPAGSTFTLTEINVVAGGNNGLPFITSEITIQGNGSTIERDAASINDFRIFFVDANDLTLEDTTVSGGVANVAGGLADDGGGILNYGGTLTLNNSTVTGNNADSSGGGIYSYLGTITLTNSTVSGNMATGINADGGGIYSYNATVTLSNSTVSGNNAADDGGGIRSFLGAVTLTDSTVSGNMATGVSGDGGGIHNYSPLTITNSTISGNNAADDGGGVHSYGSSTTITNSTISGNEATDIGGGINQIFGNTTITSSTISGNSSTDDGGGIANYLGTTTITNSTISGNMTTDPFGYGGGIYNYGTATITSSTISGNSSAEDGGGIFSFGTTTIGNSIVSGNSAASTGSEIVNRGGGNVVNANDFNLFGESSLTDAQAFDNFIPGANDITATSDGTTTAALGDILDTTLADNGGDTETHALVFGSPAIDVASGCPPPNEDQRGVMRPEDGDNSGTAECDIGSFELEEIAAVDTDGDGVPNITDNCPNDANPLQEDADMDGVGDACEGSGGGSGCTLVEGDQVNKTNTLSNMLLTLLPAVFGGFSIAYRRGKKS